MKTEITKRIDYIDIAKGIGMILVVLGHMAIGDKASYLIFSFHMPFFFLIDGLFCKEYKLFSEEHRTFIKTTLIRLILPYIFTCIFIILFSIILNLLKQDFLQILPDVKKRLLASIYGQGWVNNDKFPMIGAIWFLLALFWGKVIFSFFSKSKYCFPIVVLLFAIGYISSKYIYLPLSIQSGLTSIIFIWAGKKIKELDILSKDFLLVFIIALELWISMLFLKGGSISICSNYFEAIPANIISGVCGSIVLILLSKKIESFKITRILKYIGKYSLIFLCLHIIDLTLFPWSFIMKHITTENDLFNLGILFIMKMLMYFCGCFIILHTPLRKIYANAPLSKKR